MKIIEYLTMPFKFLKKNFSKKKKNSLDDLIKHESELINIYNNLLFSFERLYSKFYGEKIQFVPITNLRRGYEKLFDHQILNEFRIYQKNRELILRRKGLGGYF